MIDKNKINKIIKKIESILSKGIDNKEEYYDYLLNESVINYQYLKLAFSTKYSINIDLYSSINDLVEGSINTILINNQDIYLKEYKKILDIEGYYQLGDAIKRKSDDNYLGTLTVTNNSYIVTVGDVELYKLNIDTFPTKQEIKKPIEYDVNNIVFFNNNIYKNINSYELTRTNYFSPTYSSYWTQSVIPTYSVTSITFSNNPIVDYKNAIRVIKNKI